MQSTPLVSILIPTYNRAHLIEKTLDSVHAQTYQNWECIVVDDGSTDTTEELLLSYTAKDDRFQYHKRPDTYLPGGNGARNYGFDVSSGAYINWFDSDDLMMPNKLKIQISMLHQTTYDYAICQSLMYDMDNGRELGLRANRVSSDNIFQDYIKFKIFWLTQAPLWKRSFLEKYDLKFDENLKQSQDYDFHIRVLAVSENYSFTEEPLVKVCCHSDNMSKSLVASDEKLKSNLYVKNEIIKNYGARLSRETKRAVFNHLLELFRHVVFTRSISKVSIVFPSLILHISEMELTIFERIGVIIRSISGAFLYITFKKGYSYLKIKI